MEPTRKTLALTHWPFLVEAEHVIKFLCSHPFSNREEHCHYAIGSAFTIDFGACPFACGLFDKN